MAGWSVATFAASEQSYSQSQIISTNTETQYQYIHSSILIISETSEPQWPDLQLLNCAGIRELEEEDT